LKAKAKAPEIDLPAPFLKWAGGKASLVPTLVTMLPARWERYHEPFLGGGALFFHLRPEGARLGDANADLVNCYRQLALAPGGLIGQLEVYEAAHSRDVYYATRAAWNEGVMSPLGRAAAFVYLNRTCFNGVWRVNKAGKFNVPMGRTKKPWVVDHARLRACSAALQGAVLNPPGEMRPGCYQATSGNAKAGDLIYFDPPYDGTFDYGVPFAQPLLAAWFRMLNRRGVQLMLSNADTPSVRELYSGFRIDSVSVRRSVRPGTAAAPEVVVRNY